MIITDEQTDSKQNLLGLVYVGGAFVSLLVLMIWHYSRFDSFGTGLMLGWDTPDYVRLAKEVLTIGPISSIVGHSYPQLYVQLLAGTGGSIGNLTLMEKILPFVFALLSIYFGFVFGLRISHNVHVAGASAFLQVVSIGFLEVLSSNHRNMMAFTLALAGLLIVERMWTTGFDGKKLLLGVSVFVITASTQFETFIVLATTVLICSLLTRSSKNLAVAAYLSGVPLVSLAVFLPGFFGAFFGSFGVPILTHRTNLTFSDLIFWTGGSIATLALLAFGTMHALSRWTKRANVLALFTSIWSAILLGIFFVIAAGITDLSSEFGIRALLLIPSYLLIPLGMLSAWSTIRWISVRYKLPSPHTWLSHARQFMVPALFVIVILSSAVMGVTQSQVYFNPYISASTYDKMVQGFFYIRDHNLGVPVVLMNGESVWYANLYREYAGSLVGEHFAYFGTFEDLLRLVPSTPTYTDPYASKMQKYYSTTFLQELTGNLTVPSPFLHDSYVKDANTLLSHPILLVTPDLYSSPVPFALRQFHLGFGVYVIPPNGLRTLPENPTVQIPISRDNIISTVPGTYTYLDATDPDLAQIVVNASEGWTSYNITSVPQGWKLLSIKQGNDPSRSDLNPHRPNGDPAIVGNDPSDSLRDWKPVPDNARITNDTVDKKEGTASVKVQGITDSYSNLGAVLSVPLADAAQYDSLAFWAKCVRCNGISVYLVDIAGQYRLYYDTGSNTGMSTNEFGRYEIALTSSSVQSRSFNIHAITSMSFLAFGSENQSLTLWIDDVTFQHRVANLSSIYKGRVLPSDTVVFQFTEKLSGLTNARRLSPVLSYPSYWDIAAFMAVTVVILAIVTCPIYSKKVGSMMRFRFRKRRETWP